MLCPGVQRLLMQGDNEHHQPKFITVKMKESWKSEDIMLEECSISRMSFFASIFAMMLVSG